MGNDMLWEHAMACPYMLKTDIVEINKIIYAYFAEKVLFAENKAYICRIICGEWKPIFTKKKTGQTSPGTIKK